VGKIIVTLLFILLLPFAGWTQSLKLGKKWTVQYRGNFSSEGWYFPKEHQTQDFNDFVFTFKGQMDLTFQSSLPIELKLNPRLVVDPADNHRNRYLINDLYLDWFGQYFELRAGYQIFSWKTVESVSPADLLNQKDYEVDFFNAEKLGEPAVRSRVIFELKKEHVFEFYYLPYFTPAPLPGASSRFYFFSSAPTLSVMSLESDPNEFLYYSSSKRFRPQGAVRYQTQFFEAVDLSVYYFNGFNRFPLLKSTASNFVDVFGSTQKVPTTFYFNHRYRPIHQGGVTFQGVIGNWLMKGESAYQQFIDTVINDFGFKIEPSLSITTGTEYTFYGPMVKNQDLGTILEVIYDTDSGKDSVELSWFKPFRNNLFGGLRYTFNNTSDRSLLVGGFWDWKENEFIYQAEYDERLSKRFKLNIEVFGLNAVEGSQLKNFEHAGRGAVNLKYSW